jgi:hypothetical protein
MAKYSEKAQKKIGKVMEEFKDGKLKSSAGQKVTNRKQAVAIGISEARAEGDKVPSKKKPSTTTKKKASASRSSSK